MGRKSKIERAKAHKEKRRREAEEAAFKKERDEGTTLRLPFKDMYITKDGELYFLYRNVKFWTRHDRVKLKFQKVRREFINRGKPPFHCQVIRERLRYIEQERLIRLLEDEYTRLFPEQEQPKQVESGVVDTLPDVCKRSDDWRNIEFLNGEIVGIYDGKRFSFKWKDSKAKFQKLQACLRHVRLPYGFEIEDGKITRLFIENRVFRFIHIVSQCNLDFKEFRDFFQNRNPQTTFTGLQQKLIPFYPYAKQRYFSHLLTMCRNDIYRLKEERAYESHNSTTTEYSFLFEVARNGRIYWVWEMRDAGRATYVFTRASDKKVEIVRKELLNFLVSPVRNKRQNLTSERIKDLHGITGVNRINHSSSEDSFKNWQKRLETIMP